MRTWLRDVYLAIKTVGQGMYITLWYFFQTYKRKTFTERFEYPELPVAVKLAFGPTVGLVLYALLLTVGRR